MSKLFKSKFLMGVLVVAAVFAFVGFANQAAAASCSITSTLRVGATGTQVSCLQTLVGATADGKFGPKTATAVKAFQSAHGLTADGVVGPMTRAALMGTTGSTGCPAGALFNPTTGAPCTGGTNLPAGCTSTVGYSSTTGAKCDGTTGGTSTGPLTGGAGSISSTTLLSTYSGEVVNEGETANILAFDVKADTGSDLSLGSLKLKFTHAANGGSGSYHMDRYMNKVVVYLNGTKVGEANVADFSKNTDNSYSGNVTLSNAVIRAGQKGTLTVGVTANSTIDSTDQHSAGLDWTVLAQSLRYQDATGVVLTETLSGITKTAGFSTLANSGDIKLKLAEATSNPVAGIVEVSETASTADVPMLAFTLNSQGAGTDITQITFAATSSGDSDGINEIISNWELYQGSTLLGSYDSDTSISTAMANSATSGNIVFDGLTLHLDKDQTATFTVKAKVKQIGTGTGGAAAFDQGDSVTLSFNTFTSNTTATVVEDDQGDTLATGNRSGSVTGNAQSFYSKGIVVSLVSKTATKTVSPDTTNTTDTGTYVVNFDVTAVGGDMYIDKSSLVDASAGVLGTTPKQGTEYRILKNGTAVDAGAATYATPSSILTADGSTSGDTATDFKVIEGQTRHFHLTVAFGLDHSNGTDSDGFYRVQLDSINWATADNTGDKFYTFNLGDYATPDLSLSDYSLSS